MIFGKGKSENWILNLDGWKFTNEIDVKKRKWFLLKSTRLNIFMNLKLHKVIAAENSRGVSSTKSKEILEKLPALFTVSKWNTGNKVFNFIARNSKVSGQLKFKGKVMSLVN